MASNIPPKKVFLAGNSFVKRVGEDEAGGKLEEGNLGLKKDTHTVRFNAGQW